VPTASVPSARFAASPPPSKAFTDPDRAKKLAELVPKLEQRVDAFFAEQEPPSLAVAMVADGKVAFTRFLGQRDKASKAPVTEHTLYRIGSITKTFTATAVLALRDEGLLKLDQPAETYLPELARIEYPFPDAPRITLRHLLTHTSGLPRLGDFDYTRSDRDVTESEMLGALDRTTLDHAPGLVYVYSNFGAALLGSLIARRAPEKSVRVAISKRLTEPLGMSETTFEPATVPGSQPATGYAKKTDANPAPLWRLGASEAAGGLWSTAPDMARWLAFQLAAWPARAEPETQPVRRASLREAHLPQVAVGLNASSEGGVISAQASAIGLIWHTQETCEYERIVVHDGAIDGFSSSVGFAPERGFGFVVMASSLDTPTVELQRKLFQDAAPVLLPREELPAPSTTGLMTKLASTFGKCEEGAYSELFTADFRTHVSLSAYTSTCKKLYDRHGSCRLGSVRSVEGPNSGVFELSCERGAIEANGVVQTAGGEARFRGLGIRSTGFEPSRPVLDAARSLLALNGKWDDARARSLFARPDLRDKVKESSQKLRAELGSCRLTKDAEKSRSGDGERTAILPLSCDKGAPSELQLTLDPDGKLTQAWLRPRKGSKQRCVDAAAASTNRLELAR
jgi:CubicO group peptidase (beta-lactamase class C family)